MFKTSKFLNLEYALQIPIRLNMRRSFPGFFVLLFSLVIFGFNNINLKKNAQLCTAITICMIDGQIHCIYICVFSSVRCLMICN